VFAALTARSEASNKRTADASASLSLVRQLYHLKVITAYEDPSNRRKRRLEAEMQVCSGLTCNRNASVMTQVPTYEVSIAPELEQQLDAYLADVCVRPVLPQPEVVGQSLLTDIKLAEFPPSTTSTACGNAVPWAPPMPNWNPWTAANIDEGMFAVNTLQQTSDDLLQVCACVCCSRHIVLV
jgi:ATP-dependent RNA helicase A